MFYICYKYFKSKIRELQFIPFAVNPMIILSLFFAGIFVNKVRCEFNNFICINQKSKTGCYVWIRDLALFFIRSPHTNMCVCQLSTGCLYHYNFA